MSETYLYTPNKQSVPKLNVWCAFPAVYNFGMSALGFLNIFKLIDEIDGVLAEKVFTDTKTTYIQIKDIDLISFAQSFELDFIGIFDILNKYKIPFFANERDENHPLILGGGVVLSANPEPFSQIFDFIIIGDGEVHINEIIEILINNKEKLKQEKLKLLAEIEGVYVPSIEQKVVKKVTSTIDCCTSTPILSKNSFFPNTYIIEIERGCPKSCRFCLASFINKPVRFCPYEKIIEKIDEGLKYTNKLALLGALVCSHPYIDDICDYIIKKSNKITGLEVSISSLRADYVSEKVLEMLYICGQKTATIAVEAGSERLRNLINKQLKKEDIINLVDKMVLFGFSGLKMYGILGLPTETYKDIDEFINLCKEIKQKHKKFNIIPSFSTFVPKAQTPFQFAPRENTKSLENKNEYIKKNLAKIGIKARTSSVKWDYIQSLLSRGDRRLTPYLIDVYNNGANLGNFKSIYKKYEKENKLPKADIIAINEIPIDKPLAWDFIENTTKRKILETEYLNIF